MDPRRLAAVVSLLVVSRLVAGADSRQIQQPPPTFRTDVDLIAVEVSVLDRDGHPLAGLTAPDFTVTVGGQARRVASAEYISRGSGSLAEALPDDPAITDNQSLQPVQQVLLVVDTGGTSAGARDAVLAAADHLLQGLAASDSIGLATVPRSTTAVEFTTDRALLRERLTRADGWTFPPLLDQPFTVTEVEGRTWRNCADAAARATTLGDPRLPKPSARSSDGYRMGTTRPASRSSRRSSRAPGLSQGPTNETELLQRLRAYVGRYQESASAVVAEERYIQEYWRRRFPHPAPLHATRRELRSEMGFTFFAAAGIWFGFRDVLEVDGAPVPNREQELRRLFLDGRVPSGEQFRRVAEASARFNIGPGQRNFNVPMMTLLFASREHFERASGAESIGGRRASVVWR